MTIKQAIFHLEQILKVCANSHMETEAEALALAVSILKDHEQHRRSWEEILAEERT